MLSLLCTGSGTEDFTDIISFFDLPGANKFGREYRRNREDELYQHISCVVDKELKVAMQEEIKRQ